MALKKEQTDNDKRIEEIMAQERKKQMAKMRKWSKLSEKDLHLEMNELMHKDDDMMDQDILFDLQQLSAILLKKRKYIDSSSYVQTMHYEQYNDKPIKAPEKIDFDNMSEWVIEQISTDSDLSKSLSILFDQYNGLSEEGRKIANMVLVSVLGWQIHTMAVRTKRVGE